MFQFQKSINIRIHFLLLFTGSTFLILTKTNAQLPNPCKFNEFRCTDGSDCLVAEKLCNGFNDCAGGEDETGNEQWDCSRLTLSSNCRRGLFKCRLGDCIPDEQKCDGIAQCWGGSDESLELCAHTRPRPIRPAARPSVPVTGTLATTTEKTISRRPETTTTQRTTTPPVQHVSSTSSSPSPGCPVLEEVEGMKISCSYENFPIQCTSKHSPEGTSALYSCKTYWSPPATGSQTTRRTCQNGSWTTLRNFYCDLNCGVAGIKAAGFIVGGVTAGTGQWPWHVGLYQQNPPGSNNYEYFCGATLISKRALLTAAHCVTKSQSSEVRRDPIVAMLGKYNRTFGNDDNFVQKYSSIEIDVEEYYNAHVFENDIAIVWLDREVTISERVRPVCLPQGENNIEPGFPGTLVGWGRWADRGYPEELQQAKLPVVLPSECKKTHPSLETLSRSTTFCAGYRNGTSACDGDSGGGMTFEEGGKWYIQGVVSAGISIRAGGCDPNYYTVFTKVEKFTRWIHNLLDRKDSLLKVTK